MVKRVKNRKMTLKQRLVLGTVQLGVEYGIANSEGKPDQVKVEQILKTSLDSGIVEFDTAQGYGNSEAVVGRGFSSLGAHKNIRIITKIHPSLNHEDDLTITNAVDESFERLGVSNLWGLLIHHERHITSWERGLYSTLRRYTEKGEIKHLGISVYSVEKALEALDTKGISIVQLPTNVLDRKFEDAKVFEIANEKGKQIYIRSIFLQGLLLMDPSTISGKMAFTAPLIRQFHELCRRHGYTPQEVAMCYIKQTAPKAKILFGAESPRQVKENVDLFNKEIAEACINEIRETFQNVDKKILDPSLWNK